MAVAQAKAATETVVHTFGDFPNGANPYATLIRDSAGNLYGTTYQGGAGNVGVVFRLNASGYKLLYSFLGGSDGAEPYAGVVFKLDPSGEETVLYTFSGGSDGGNPYAGVTLDSAGNLYGTTYDGGDAGLGVVYRLSPLGQETVLHSFTGGADGASPYSGLSADASGNLYGTTKFGGFLGGAPANTGVVYKVDPSGVETVLHTFPGGASNPESGVVLDSSGNLYGTANCVYKLSPSGQFTVLATFPISTTGGVARDASGNLYGTTVPPGGSQETQAHYGVVYKVDTMGRLTVLYKFPGASNPGLDIAGAPDGTAGPNPGVVLDAAGDIFGATPYGGLAGMVYEVQASGQMDRLYALPGAPGGTVGSTVLWDAGSLYGTAEMGGSWNAGALFKVGPSGRFKTIYSFTGGADGGNPLGALASNSEGGFYGTTFQGGSADLGVVYEIDASGHETVLHSFTGGADGGNPEAGVTLDTTGNLYGTTAFGGAGGQTGLQEGVVFKLDSSGRETLLHSFTGLSDGGMPSAGVIRDAAGNLYGTTCEGGQGSGVVYEISAAGQFTVLHSFAGATDGACPFARVIRDGAGDLYGTTSSGGGGVGTLYKLDAAGNFTVLFRFAGVDGSSPLAGVVRDTAGNLYGTTSAGGLMNCSFTGCGVVYEFDASGHYTLLYSFTGGLDGSFPGANGILETAGSLYGITGDGGDAGAGVLYKLTLQ